MKPPICALCDERFAPTEGALVRFVSTAASEAWRARAVAEPGFVGHPPDLAWFCGVHRAAAEALAHLTLADALAKLRAPANPVLARAAAYAKSLGVDPLPELLASTSRRWDPIDGCSPPHCPYVDEHVLDGASDRGRVRVTRTEAWWNEQELANTHTVVTVWAADGRHLGTTGLS